MRVGGFPSRERDFNLSEEISRNGRVEGSEDKKKRGHKPGTGSLRIGRECRGGDRIGLRCSGSRKE